jgi:hypothetical protein
MTIHRHREATQWPWRSSPALWIAASPAASRNDGYRRINQMQLSLLEVLISFCLLSLVMLGMNAMQLSSLHQLQASLYVAAASEQLASLDNYLQSTHGTNPSEFIDEWKSQIAEMLPSGAGELHGEFPSYVISIFWGGTNANTCQPPQAGKHGCLSLER